MKNQRAFSLCYAPQTRVLHCSLRLFPKPVFHFFLLSYETGTIYTAAPPDNPLSDIIRDNQLLYRKLESYKTDIARKLFLHELQAYVRRYAISNGDYGLCVSIAKPAMNIYYVDELLARIEAEMSLYKERIRFHSHATFFF